MKTIWKFPLQTTDQQSLEMPESAEILSVQVQGETPCLWALVDPQAIRLTRVFETFGTGHPVPVDAGHIRRKFIGTYQLLSGALVFHVFERI